MELFTTILIWIGILTAVVVVALAIHEYIWKPFQRGGTDARRQRDQEVTSPFAVKEVTQAESPPEPVESEPASEPDAGSEKAAEPDDGPEQQFKRLTRSDLLINWPSMSEYVGR